MTGSKALLIRAAIVAFTLILGVVFVRIGVKGAKTNKLGYPLVVAALFVMFMFTVPFVAQVRTFMFLHRLQANDVLSMSIGKQVMTSEQIAAVTQAFQDLHWFTAMHGGWGKEIPVEIHVKGGKVVHLYVATYPYNGSGAVIRGRLGGIHEYLTFDCCFLSAGDKIPQPSAPVTQQ